jgi:hypothetical protein
LADRQLLVVISDAIEKTIDKLPDIWFDWYARLLPGFFGVGLYLYLSETIPADPTASNVFFLLFSGYVLGHAIQPPVGFLIKEGEKRFGNELDYARAKRDPQITPSSIGKVTKAHAEANSMLSFCVATILNLLYFWNAPLMNRPVAFGLIGYFALPAIGRICARNRKIKDLNPPARPFIE